ncbi:MAG: SufD family Fe-S cluster assembly protein [Deltaproteobacteria bacterium]|nr:SufD family Fe-S cluster assembly protein [Deltaproteobacteria bacterium]
MLDVRSRAEQAREKKAALGADIDLSKYSFAEVSHPYLQDLRQMPPEDREQMLNAGVDANEVDRSGTFIQKDSAVLYSKSRQEGLEIYPVKEALEKLPWVEDYYGKLVAPETDKYTAAAELSLQNGYLIRALPEASVSMPVQSCLYLDRDGMAQTVHNIVICEEGSELHVITGCATSPHLRNGLHLGITEFYIKKNAKLSFTMIHNWAKNMAVRPRSVGVVEEGGLFLNNYICMKPVKSLQMYPTTYLRGPGATARFYSILLGHPGSELDVGGRIILEADKTRAEIISRAITNGGTIVARGDLVGEKAGIKAHLECKGLILKGGVIHAIPELKGKAEGVEMSHEAAVGKIAAEEIQYLQSRGLSEEEATSTIVRGFMSVDIPGLPKKLKAKIDQAVAQSEKEMM